MQIMITNGGTHPADKWADTVTDQIVGLVQVPEDSVTVEAKDARAAKRQLRPALFDMLNAHFERVQSKERAECKKHKGSRLDHALNVTEHIPGIRQSVKAALASTPFADHFAKPEVWQVVETFIAQATADNMHIERRHHDHAAKGA